MLGFGGRYFSCAEVKLGWHRSGYWLDRFMGPLVFQIRERLSPRVLFYIEDLLGAPNSVGRISSERVP